MKPFQTRCEHCGKWRDECSLVTAFADTGAICDECWQAHDEQYWHDWVVQNYPDLTIRQAPPANASEETRTDA